MPEHLRSKPMVPRYYVETVVSICDCKPRDEWQPDDGPADIRRRQKPGPWALRQKVSSWFRLAAAPRDTDEALIELWRISPHLLDDIGIKLTRAENLPGHLLPAPKALFDLVARTAPEQIVRAELDYPPEPAARADAAPASFARPARAGKSLPWGLARAG
jgi:uncharacterized protein YjiS (DUF1127 family)